MCAICDNLATNSRIFTSDHPHKIAPYLKVWAFRKLSSFTIVNFGSGEILKKSFTFEMEGDLC